MNNNNTFDLNNFLNVQNKIINKLKCPYKKINQIIDLFLISIIEEVYEAKEEIKTGNVESFQLEIIDILMYIGSCINELKNGLIENDEYYNDTVKYYDNIINYRIKYNKEYQKNFYLEYDDFIDDLMKIRMKFPERKYHKKFNGEINDQERNHESINILLNIFSLVFDKYIIIPIEELNILINDKQNMVLSLETNSVGY